MKKSLSPLVSIVILVGLTIVLSVYFSSSLSSISQNTVSSRTICTGMLEISKVDCEIAPPELTNFSVLLLRFNEGYGNISVDEAGKNNNITLSNITWVSGKFSYAAYFNETSLGNVTNSMTLDPEEITIEIWVKPE